MITEVYENVYVGFHCFYRKKENKNHIFAENSYREHLVCKHYSTEL